MLRGRAASVQAAYDGVPCANFTLRSEALTPPAGGRFGKVGEGTYRGFFVMRYGGNDCCLSHKGCLPYRLPGPSTYNDNMRTYHPGTMANRARTHILINKQRFSKNFDRFFRGRDSMKGDRRPLLSCMGPLNTGPAVPADCEGPGNGYHRI
jgi:hypothetical protein